MRNNLNAKTEEQPTMETRNKASEILVKFVSTAPIRIIITYTVEEDKRRPNLLFTSKILSFFNNGCTINSENRDDKAIKIPKENAINMKCMSTIVSANVPPIKQTAIVSSSSLPGGGSTNSIGYFFNTSST